MTAQTFDCRNAWADAMAEAARADERVVVVVNDSVGSSKLNAFVDEFPERSINVGIAEQNMVGVAAGLANGGKIPFVSAAGCFLSARAMEQIKADVAYSEHNVKLVAQSPGVAYGDLGPTHHSIEDFAWMRTIPGLTVVAPVDPVETAQVIAWAAGHEGPAYIRVSRMAVPAVYPEGYQFVPGKAVTLREGTAAAIIATGTTVARALAAADLLAADGVEVRVLAMPTIKPLDEAAVVAAAAETGGVVTVEEALVTGLGGAVAEVLAEQHPAPLRRIGFRDEFAITGTAEWLLDRVGASPEGIAATVRELA
ncbi:transketolase family protein [Tessaracoccus defluvii]|uniref:Transketolase family protein n=1 Tax=Tessaracoccus defluvii TaxID=1285901 RepID=A0A7H0H344_9ACTN|nr:transketolase C-terminal domain-containing protein [Tessaracoccus defluvii]QNP54960.1 transketolase family protein [Tessaracoccus defluvii]